METVAEAPMVIVAAAKMTMQRLECHEWCLGRRWRTSGHGLPRLEEYRAMAAGAGTDGSLCGSLRLGSGRRLSGRWRGILESLVGRARLHDGGENWIGEKKKGVAG